MKRRILLTIFFIFILLGGTYLFRAIINGKDVSSISTPQVQLPVIPPSPSGQSDQANQPNQSVSRLTNEITKEISLDVPFTVQAPFKNWSDPVFQNACEEASIIMAMGWINGVRTITPADANKQILDIVDFENKTFGYNADTDVLDVEKIFQNYFHYEDISVGEGITIEDIKNELQSGNLIITPMFGQSLGNPNYTAPGPIDHMLVVIGYNPLTKEFVTNDPGTQRGGGYRYGEDVLFKAIWEYPSSSISPQPPTGVLKKAMVIVRK